MMDPGGKKRRGGGYPRLRISSVVIEYIVYSPSFIYAQ